jgi:1-phosphofructokinase
VIVTLTPNPSVDRTVEVDSFVRGAVLRATGTRVDAGGKGVNVSRALAAHGHATCAVLPIGGFVGAQLEGLLRAELTDVVAVPVVEELRANVSVVEPDGTVTKLNEAGPRLTWPEVEALLETTLAVAAEASWVVLSGSLPPGCPDDFYATVVSRLDAPVALDTSGGPLLAALGSGPALVKPNREELQAATGLPVTTVGEAVAAAQALRLLGAGTVLASLGRDGAILVQDDGTWYGEAPVDAPVSSVGAGDAALAGFLAAGGRGPDALAQALAFGAAAVQLPGSRVPWPADLDLSAVRISATVPTERNLKDDPS